MGCSPALPSTSSATAPYLGPGSLKRFDYAVIGDSTTMVGLAAPFDEENTSETFVVEDLTETILLRLLARPLKRTTSQPRLGYTDISDLGSVASVTLRYRTPAEG